MHSIKREYYLTNILVISQKSNPSNWKSNVSCQPFYFDSTNPKTLLKNPRFTFPLTPQKGNINYMYFKPRSQKTLDKQQWKVQLTTQEKQHYHPSKLRLGRGVCPKNSTTLPSTFIMGKTRLGFPSIGNPDRGHPKQKPGNFMLLLLHLHLHSIALQYQENPPKNKLKTTS